MAREQSEHERDAEVSIAIPVPVTDSRLFGNKAIDDMLAFLIRNRRETFGVRELAEEIEHSRSTVSRAVDILVANGVIEEERGTRRLVGVDHEQVSVPDDPVLEVPQPAYRPPVRAAVDALTRDLSGVVAVVLHGPVARGVAGPRHRIRLLALVDGEVRANSGRADRVASDLAARRFDGERYEFEMAVHDVATVSERNADTQRFLLDGITLYRTAAFEAIR